MREGVVKRRKPGKKHSTSKKSVSIARRIQRRKRDKRSKSARLRVSIESPIATRKTSGPEPLIIVDLTNGLADRNRLPLAFVTKALREIEAMINDVGSRILSERGVEEPNPDFGLELVAEAGIAFHKGSVRATLAITRYLDVGLLAAGEVIKTIGTLSVKKHGPVMERGTTESLSARVVRGLDRIAFINQAAKTKTKLEVKAPRSLLVTANLQSIALRRATFGEMALENLRALRVPSFEESNVRLYGKLFHLKDKPIHEENESIFWGELYADNGQRWRVQFDAKDLDKVTPLFTQQVLVIGKAIYYQTASPKLEATLIEKDLERDIVGAYMELYGCDKDVAPEARP